MYEDGFDPDAMLRHAKSLADRAKQLEEEIESTEIEVRSPDRSISVAVSMHGKVLDIKVQGSSMDGRSSNEIATAILSVVQRSQTVAAQATTDLTKRYLPDLPDFRDTLDSMRKRH